MLWLLTEGEGGVLRNQGSVIRVNITATRNPQSIAYIARSKAIPTTSLHHEGDIVGVPGARWSTDRGGSISALRLSHCQSYPSNRGVHEHGIVRNVVRRMHAGARVVISKAPPQEEERFARSTDTDLHR